MARWVKILVMCTIYVCKGSTESDSWWLSEDDVTNVTVTNDQCTTWECLVAASWIGHNMNSSVDPCDDFYEFTCGRFGQRSSPLDDKVKSVYDWAKTELEDRLINEIKKINEMNSPKHFRMIKILYSNCIGSDEREYSYNELFNWHEKLRGPTGWPVLAGDQWNSISINKEYIMSQLIDIQLRAGIVVPTAGIAWIETKTQGLDHAVLRMGFDNEIVQAYYDYMQDMAIILGAAPDAAARELKEALITEIMLANDTLPEANRWKIADNYERTTVGEFTAKYPYMKGFIYFRGPQNYKPNDGSVIMVEKTFPHVDEVVSRTPYRTLVNLVQWYQVFKKGRMLEKLRHRSDKFDNLLRGNQEPVEKKRKCLQLVRSQLGLSLSALYQRGYINQNIVEDLNEMTAYIRQKIYEIISEAEWLNGTFRTKILEKVKELTGQVGFSYEYDDDQKLEEFYRDLELSEGHVAESLKNISAFSENMPKHSKGDYWSMIGDINSPDAFYNPRLNIIRVTSVYTVGEYYDFYRPNYLNFATLGFVIAHEMAHSLDDDSIILASKADYDDEWWSPEDKEMYDQSLKCAIYQYGNYTVDELGLKLRAYRTLNENIADNLAANAAYQAYLEWESKNQLEYQLPGLSATSNQAFWIAMANAWCDNYEHLELMNTVLSSHHSPVKYRVNGALVNRPAFAKDFNCKLGSKMNPVKKCSIW